MPKWRCKETAHSEIDKKKMIKISLRKKNVWNVYPFTCELETFHLRFYLFWFTAIGENSVYAVNELLIFNTVFKMHLHCNCIRVCVNKRALDWIQLRFLSLATNTVAELWNLSQQSPSAFLHSLTYHIFYAVQLIGVSSASCPHHLQNVLQRYLDHDNWREPTKKQIARKKNCSKN